MFNKDRWKEIVEVLTSNWFRTLLTAFGVFWGILFLSSCSPQVKVWRTALSRILAI